METTLSIVNPLLKDIGEDVMGFLNEIQLRYPQAISLASGRPDEDYFGIEDFPEYFNIYVDAVAASGNKDRRHVLNSLGQYNRAKGIINAEVAKYLQNDEQVKVRPEDIVITVGTQESMCLAVMTLCDREQDVIVVEDPAYVGLTHFSIIAGYRIDAVPAKEDGISLEGLEESIIRHRLQGLQVKLVYVGPDYQNPTGSSMPVEKRQRLLNMAAQYDFFILEDNAYGEFAYEGEPSPPLKAMDTNDRVIYMRSFSKTLYPSLRLGAMVANQRVMHEGKEVLLSDLMAKTKGYTTVNTPSINQAVFGGMLIKNNFSLRQANSAKVAALKTKRDSLVSALGDLLHPQHASWVKDISWNIPRGGFFITIRVPFAVGKKEVIACAEQFGVIFTPMSFFHLNGGGDYEIRLAFSHITPETIRPAMERLVQYFKSKILFN